MTLSAVKMCFALRVGHSLLLGTLSGSFLRRVKQNNDGANRFYYGDVDGWCAGSMKDREVAGC
jgi:hypothetical protein